MAVFQIKFKSQSTIVDSIKITRAVTYAYSILYPDKIDSFINDLKNGAKSFSALLPLINSVPMFPMPYINNIVDKNNSKSEKITAMKNRKKIPHYINEAELKECINNFSQNGYNGIKYNKIFKNENPTQSLSEPVSEPGINIYTNPKRVSGEIKYNDVFTKELYIYHDSYFIAENSDEYTDAAVMLLNDMGISGRRSTGKGRANIKKMESNIETGFKDPGFYILLSSFIPDNESVKNIDFTKSRYNISIFQGKSINGNPIGPFRYFMAGSVIYINKPVKGKVYSENNGIIPFIPLIKVINYES